MPRKKTQKPADDMTQNIDVDAIEQASKLKDELDKNLIEIDAIHGDGLPYDTNRLINETRFYLQQSADSMLEAGKRMLLLKEHEPHGEFTEALEKIGIDPRAARRMMQAAYKFSAPKRSALTVLGKTKLLELMVEDDEELDALADGGTMAGQTLDDIQRMTTRELQAALRKEREKRQQDQETSERMLTSKNNKIDKLDKKIHDLQSRSRPWDKRCNDINIEVTSIASQLLQSCNQLDDMRDTILTEHFDDDNPAAIEMMAITYHNAVTEVTTKIDELNAACEEAFAGYKV